MDRFDMEDLEKTLEKDEFKNIENLIFSGGGIKCISIIGYLKKINENIPHHIFIKQIHNIFSVSAGSIIALLYIFYTPDELHQELLQINFSHFFNFSISNFINQWGFCSSDYIITTIQTLLLKKGISHNLTFNDLSLNLHIFCTNLNNYSIAVFNKNNTPDFPILDAIRMSISIPFIFTISLYNNHIFVDGGLISSYPIIYILNNFNINSKTLLGIRVISDKPNNININSIYDYIYHIFNCYNQRHFLIHPTSRLQPNTENTIHINTKNFKSVNPNINHSDITELINIGYLQYTEKDTK